MSDPATPPPNAPQDDKFHQGDDDIQDFFGKVKYGWTRWGDWIMWSLVVIMGSYALYNYWCKHRDNSQIDAQQSLASDSGPILLQLAKDNHEGTVPVQAALRAGDLFRNESLKATDDKSRKEALTKAEEAYRLVLSHEATQDLYIANAQLGLACVAEDQAKWDEAAKAYDAVLVFKDRFVRLGEIATGGKARLKTLQQPVVWGPEAPPPASPSSDTAPGSFVPATPDGGGVIRFGSDASSPVPATPPVVPVAPGTGGSLIDSPEAPVPAAPANPATPSTGGSLLDTPAVNGGSPGPSTESPASDTLSPQIK